MKRENLSVRAEQAFLVGACINNDPHFEESLKELAQLAKTAGASVVGEITQKKSSIDPAFYIGRGKVQQLNDAAQAQQADVIIFDNDLSPAQVRNLERATNTKVLDRSELILDIFATRARTHQAKLQVELAQLEYTLPRLKRMWTHLSRIKGGIGLRGPGEQQIEEDRRVARNKIKSLKETLNRLEKKREQEVLHRSDTFSVCLVGYTNAGKSTLMNALTKADVFVEDKLFATLDTRTRNFAIAGFKHVLLSDTIGFIRNLPHHLIASFKATLEEVKYADLLLHVVDVSHPEVLSQIESVNTVLKELNVSDKPILMVLNKIDQLTDSSILRIVQEQFSDNIVISALKKIGLENLRAKAKEILERNYVMVTISFPAGLGRVNSFLSEYSEIIERQFSDEKANYTVKIDVKNLAKLKKMYNSECQVASCTR